MLGIYNAELAQQYFSEAFDKAQTSGDLTTLFQVLTVLAAASFIAGEPLAALAAAEEGCRLADELGDRFSFRGCETWRGATMWLLGDLTQSAEILRGMAVEADSVGHSIMATFGYAAYGFTLAHRGQADAARAAAQTALRAAEAAGGYYLDTAYAALALAALADRDPATAGQAAENSWRYTVSEREPLGRCFNPMAEAAWHVAIWARPETGQTATSRWHRAAIKRAR